VHELSIAQALIERVTEEAASHGASRVKQIWLQVGALSGVEAELLATAFEIARERTFCDGAALELQRVPVRWSCPDCDQEIADGVELRCTRCGRPAQLLSGGELILERVELELPDV